MFYKEGEKSNPGYNLAVKTLHKSCPTLCDPMDYSPPGYSVHGILQARILEGVATPSSRTSSQSRDPTQVSRIAILYGLSGNKTHGWETKGKLQNAELKEDLSTSLFYRLRNRHLCRFKDLAKVNNWLLSISGLVPKHLDSEFGLMLYSIQY